MAALERVSVLGAGLMGHGIAQVLASAGHPVAVFDTSPEALGTVHERIRAGLELLSADPAIADRVEIGDDLAGAVAGAGFVFEAVWEDLAVKRDLIARVSRQVEPGAVLATNTSVIAVGEIAADAERPERVVGAHWWNPPHLIPLVEVVEAERTSAAVVARTIELLDRAGKAPVHVRRDIPGFVGNRLQHALWREAIALVGAGVCDAEEVDRIVKQGFGRRLAVLGPLENADMVGLDLTLAIHEYLLPHLDRDSQPAAILRELVGESALGMKAGRGFRAWTEPEAGAVVSRLNSHLLAAAGVDRREVV